MLAKIIFVGITLIEFFELRFRTVGAILCGPYCVVLTVWSLLCGPYCVTERALTS